MIFCVVRFNANVISNTLVIDDGVFIARMRDIMIHLLLKLSN